MQRFSTPSASLIHEIRMIAQSFFAQRTTASIFQPRESSPLLCVTCLRGGRNRKAVVIDEGRSVCKLHLVSK